MNRNLAVLVLIIMISSMVSILASPAAFAAGSHRLDARPYFQTGGNATSIPTGLNTTQVWNAYGFFKMSCSMESPVGWNYVNLCGYGQTVAIVDAYDDPNIEKDLATFDRQWELPDCSTANGCFAKVTPNGIPDTNATWALEESLEVEWAHATAPGAKIVLVESPSNSLDDLIHSLKYTETYTGARQISIGWGVAEFQNETMYDSYFSNPGISFFSPSGNGASILYPAASPHVISVGGTTLHITGAGAVRNEVAWSQSAGGPSFYEDEPTYQIASGVQSGDKRAVPDVSYNANPRTGFAVYDSTQYDNQSGWFLVGGTSAGVPQWASIVAIANSQGAKLTSDRDVTSSSLYTAATGTLYSSNYRDITVGGNNVNQATAGYDFVSGLGSPISNKLVTFLSPKPADPSSPLDLAVAESNQQISLKWQAPSFGGGLPVTRYSIYRGSSSGGEMFLNSVPTTNQSYVDLDLENGVTYYYYVTAANTLGESTGSNEVYATPDAVPSAPEDLATTLTDGTVYLTWSPSSSTNGSPITKYNVYRATSPGHEVLLKSVSGDALSCTDMPKENYPSYYYYVTATNGAGESTPSNEESVSEPPSAPSAPQHLEVEGASQQITLSWQAPDTDGGKPIVKYNIYAGTSSGGETFLSSVPHNVLNYTNYYLVNGATYYYYVTAVNSVGESLQSNEVYFVPG